VAADHPRRLIAQARNVPVLFYIRRMASRDLIDQWHGILAAPLGHLPHIQRRTPIGQMIKSSISSRTRDAVSLAAFHGLKARFGSAAGIAHAEVKDVEHEIAAVTFADVKARRLIEALRQVEARHPDFRLDHLATFTIPDALGELEQLPGVGRKTAASVLNFSTLRRPVLVVDTHVARVLARLGLTSDAVRVSESVTQAMSHWHADRFVSFHVQLKHLGQTICRWDRPNCRRCPLSSACRTARGYVRSDSGSTETRLAALL
jgi:endonuclease-3